MIPERIELGQGVALNLLACDTFKTNALTVDFLAPLSHDTVAEQALLPYVLKRGTRRLPTPLLLAREEERLYGTSIHAHFGRMGDTQFFGFSAAPLRCDFTEGQDITLEVLSLIGEMLLDPYYEDGLLAARYVECEKRFLADRVRATINDKYSYSLQRCREEMRSGDSIPLTPTGTVAEIEAVTPASLTVRLSEVLASCRIEIWCVGAFDRQALIDTVCALFAGKARRAPTALSVTPFVPSPQTKRITESQAVKQGKLCLGFGTPIRTDHPLAPAYTLFREVLANSPTAKLFLHVREKLSLCYYCSAIPDGQKGMLILASGIEVSNKDKAEQAILAEVEACRLGHISESEMAAAKKAVHHAIHAMYDDPASLITWYFKRGSLGLSESPLSYL
ncbi:MAG: insulinase family protein, partial [Ruminococcaceae bacterium]|nr:insulinase family protein [Oscillospiraceae bacterium]